MPETIAFENPIEDDAENGSDDDGDDDTTSVENPLQVELENTDAERVARLKEIFKELDEDGSGAVGIEELKRGLIKTKIIRSKLAAGELFHKVRAVQRALHVLDCAWPTLAAYSTEVGTCRRIQMATW
jgi:hypothetical protein